MKLLKLKTKFGRAKKKQSYTNYCNYLIKKIKNLKIGVKIGAKNKKKGAKKKNNNTRKVTTNHCLRNLRHRTNFYGKGKKSI